MLTRRTGKIRARHLAAAAFLCVTTSAFALSLDTNGPRARATAGVEFVNAPQIPARGRNITTAAERFVKGMATGDVDTVWMFATEEEQAAFGTEKEAYAAFADTFPEIVKAQRVSFDRYWQEGDTPFVAATVIDRDGKPYRAEMGFWLNDAGDWIIVSLDVKPLSDRVASR